MVVMSQGGASRGNPALLPSQGLSLLGFPELVSGEEGGGWELTCLGPSSALLHVCCPSTMCEFFWVKHWN